MKPIKNDGGPAFPSKMLVNRFATEETAQQLIGADGMTLRDYFAGQALTGYLAYSHPASIMGTFIEESARVAYEYADAMLTAREGKP